MQKLTVLVAAMALAAVPAAVSATTTITYTGTVADRQGSGDQSQYFGAVVAGTTGYTLVYTIADNPTGTVSTPDAWTTRLAGAGAVTAVLTINGIGQSVGGTTQSNAFAANAKPNSLNNPTDAVGQISQDYADNGIIYRDVWAETSLSSYLNSFLSSADYTSPFTYVPVSGDSFGSNFHINDMNWQTHVGSSIYLSLGISSVTVARTPPLVIGDAVPEPATWAMMIGGFALAGGALRRRGQAALATA